MNKAKLLVPLCAFILSGCALFETSERDPQNIPVAAPVEESERPPVAVVADAPEQELPRRPPRVFTRDEVRQIQLRLKTAGFDPGPVDGVTGARTKTAVNRYHAGCAKVKLMLNDFEDTGSLGTGENAMSKKTLTRQEIRAIQLQLRDAGFDSGPADGIFGARTKTMLAHLKANCSTVNEFAAALNESAHGADIKSVAARVLVPGDRTTKSGPTATSVSSIATQGTATVTPVRVSEETRVLQLRLRDAGFDPGAFDGVMGPKTKSALQQYEASQRGKKIKTGLRTEINGQY